MELVESPGPLHGAQAPHEGAARRPVHGEVMRCGGLEIDEALVLENLEASLRGLREPDQTAGPAAVVGVDVPLVPERAVRQRGRLARREAGDTGVSPHPPAAVRAGDLDGEVEVHDRVDDLEEGPGQLVLGTAAVRRRAEPLVPPRAGPGGTRVGLGAVLGLLVTNERLVRTCGSRCSAPTESSNTPRCRT